MHMFHTSPGSISKFSVDQKMQSRKYNSITYFCDNITCSLITKGVQLYYLSIQFTVKDTGAGGQWVATMRKMIVTDQGPR